jgi:hypothetical protein
MRSIRRKLHDFTRAVVRLTGRVAIRAVALGTVLNLSVPLPSVVHAGTHTVGAADVHMYSNDLEINLFLSQTQNWCGTLLHGQTCLRYSVAQYDSPLYGGYGLIPSTALKVTGSRITLNIDTTVIPKFTSVLGRGGTVSITWKAKPGASPVVAGKKTETLSLCTVTGSVLGYTLDQSAQLNGDMLIYTG